jgi:hypothetical protein
MGGNKQFKLLAAFLIIISITIDLSSAWPREADSAQMKLKRPPPDVRFVPKADIRRGMVGAMLLIFRRNWQDEFE